MVRVHYIGTGEAFDERSPNTSVLYDGPARVLLDCGYAVPHALWRTLGADPDLLDAIYLSHFHADHCFGLPPLLARLREDRRTRPLALLGGPGASAAVSALLEVAYPGLEAKLPFETPRLEVPPGPSLRFGKLLVRTARTCHSVPNHAVRLEADGLPGAARAVCYSGDGAPSKESEALYQNANLLIHEAYYDRVPTGSPGSATHGAEPEVLAMAARANVRQVHLVHASRRRRTPKGAHWPRSGQSYVVD